MRRSGGDRAQEGTPEAGIGRGDVDVGTLWGALGPCRQSECPWSDWDDGKERAGVSGDTWGAPRKKGRKKTAPLVGVAEKNCWSQRVVVMREEKAGM